jgi:ATP-binding protein involved in chromosome partitioning
LAQRGCKTGLWDLDFTGASDHIILGVASELPKETDGIEPPMLLQGLKFMSASLFLGDKAISMRGNEVVDALLELIAITRWGYLDFLIVDMPPGIGDTNLELSRLVKKIEFLAVVTSSVLSTSLATKAMALFQDGGMRMVGVVENMTTRPCATITTQAPVLTRINFDPELDHCYGSPHDILKTAFAQDLSIVAENFLRGQCSIGTL